MQEKLRTIHVYLEEEEATPTFEAGPGSGSTPEAPGYSKTLGLICGVYLVLLCVGIPILSAFLSQAYINTYDIAISETITLYLSPHPTASEVRLSALAPVQETEQTTVTATGSFHQEQKAISSRAASS